MQSTYQTQRLILNELSLQDEAFVYELLNTDEWKKFIGERNIKTKEDAGNYIQKIINNTSINYWVVQLIEGKIPLGIVSLIKRDYLDHPDIGFAFLPKYFNKGYATEATTIVINDFIRQPNHQCLLATTVKENKNSIKLLEKLGLSFEKEIQNENVTLLVYSASVRQLLRKDF